MNQKNRYKASATSKSRLEAANKHINFVVVVYVVILIYIISVIYLSLTKEHFSSFYAEYGQILNENNFKGIIIRDEEVIVSTDDGPVNYFIPEGTKVRQNAFVCAVNQNPELEEVINAQINKHLSQLNTAMSLTLEDHTVLQEKIRDYVIEKPTMDLTYTYAAKTNILNTFNELSTSAYIKDQALYEQVQQSIEANENEHLENGTYYRMPYSGVVGYTIDGFESFTLENFDYNLLNKEVSLKDVSENNATKKGDALFKIMDNRIIHIISEIDAYCAKYLEEKKYVTVKFPKLNLDIALKKVSIENINGKFYATFEVDRYINEFLTDRYVDMKIVYDYHTGIKIPNEAIGTKDVFQVPKSSVYEEKGLFKIQKQLYSEDDVSHQEIVPVAIKVYMVDEQYAYIEVMNGESHLSEKDKILYTQNVDERVSESSVFELTNRLTLQGVYVINKGYTDFRRINLLYSGDSFSIIEADLSYSVGLFDRVVTDANGVIEFTTIN